MRVESPASRSSPAPASSSRIDAEVVRAGERYHPDLNQLAPEHAERLVDIVRTSLHGLEPEVVVNRRVDDAVAIVARDPQLPVPTVHTAPITSARLGAQRLARSVTERLDGVHGTGDNAGNTVFGSVRFVSAEDARAGADSVLGALTAQGSAGVRAYGPVAFVVPARSVVPRMTVSADDTGATNARPAPLGRLADVVAERIVRSPGGTRRAEELLAAPRHEAVDQLRKWLLSDALAQPRTYVEAQVRGLTPHEIAGAVIDRDTTPPARRRTIDPGPPPDRSQVEQLVNGLAKIGRAHLVVG